MKLLNVRSVRLVSAGIVVALIVVVVMVTWLRRPAGAEAQATSMPDVASAAPQSSDPPPIPSPAESSDVAKVFIDNFSFKPREVTVPVGATVTWVNHDDVPHTATSTGQSPLFDSKALDTDDKYSFKFTKPGTYRYYCKIHTHMTGTVIVK